MEPLSRRPGRFTRLSVSVALVLGLALVAAPSASADVTTPVRADAHVQQSSPSANFKSAPTLVVDNSSTARRYVYVKVDHPAVPPGETVLQHHLRVHVTGAVPSTARLAADLVGNSWTEGNLTYKRQPTVLAAAPGQSQELVPGWNLVPIEATPGATQSYRIRTNVTSQVTFSSRENANGNGPVSVVDTADQAPAPAPVQTPTATRASTACGVVDVDYATGGGDNTPSSFVTTVDGVQVDSEVVTAPSGTGGHTQTITEDASGGSVDVVVSANGSRLIAFSVATDCATAWPPATPVATKTVGMSAPVNHWDSRLAEVGRCGVEARRIFVTDAESDWAGKYSLIKSVVADGMTPVISIKSPVGEFNAGQHDALYTRIRNDLVALGEEVTMTFWHEPHGDMTGAEFRAASARFLDLMDADSIAVGPILNGWLLDSKVDVFASYTDPGLLDEWEFMGVDSYHPSETSTMMPGRALYLVEDWMAAQGHDDTPLVMGEYNGYTAEAIAYGGNAILNIPDVWIGLVWNSTADGFTPLEGDRLAAYQATKADSRALRSSGC